MKDRKLEELYDNKKARQERLEKEERGKHLRRLELQAREDALDSKIATTRVTALEKELNIIGIVSVAKDKLKGRKVSRVATEAKCKRFPSGSGSLPTTDSIPASVLYKVETGHESDWEYRTPGQSDNFKAGYYKEVHWWGVMLEVSEQDPDKAEIKLGPGCKTFYRPQGGFLFNTESNGDTFNPDGTFKFNCQDFNKEDVLNNLREMASDSLIRNWDVALNLKSEGL